MKDGYHDTALMYACRNGSIDCVKLLLNNNSSINENNYIGQTALMMACEHDYVECCVLLLENDVNISIKDKNGNTAFMIACRNNSLNCVQLLIDKVDVNEKNNRGLTALGLALYKEKELSKSRNGNGLIEIREIIQLLKEHGAKK